jgi:molecular chaperone DnaK
MTIELPFIAGGMRSLELPTTRQDLENMVLPLLNRLDKPCHMALEDAEMTREDVTDVILVGGMTRMPAVKYRSRDIFNCIPHDGVDPDAAVALGAAVYSGVVLGTIEGLTFQDVIPLSLGLEIQGGQVHRILRRNAAIPTSVTKVFTTSAPNQSQVSVHILQGEEKFAPNNTSLGRFELEGIKPASRGEPEFAITFSVDAGGIVNVGARDHDTGEKKAVQIAPSAGLTEAEVQELIKARKAEEEQAVRMANRIAQMSEEQVDPEEKLREDMKNLLFLTQFNLDAQGDTYIGKRRKALEDALAEGRRVMENEVSDEEFLQAKKGLEKQAQILEEFIEEDL